jgi:hypothetical protein
MLKKARESKTNGSSIGIPKEHAEWYDLTVKEDGTLIYTPVHT